MNTDGNPENSPDEESCDVLVIGGGPSGATASALLAEKGWRVLLVEKEEYPRFHVGESLLPMNIPIFEEMGIYDKIKEIGLRKNGVDFYNFKQEPHHTTTYFDEALDNSYPYSYQVLRSEFDVILLDNAREKGVDVRQRTRITAMESLAAENCIFRASGNDGQELRISARYVIDASGRDTFLSRKLSLISRNPNHAAASIFSHFRNVRRRPGRDEGNIGLHWFEDGWCWVIPLKDGITSVGAVFFPEYLETRNGEDLDAFLWRTLGLVPTLNDIMSEAEMVIPAQGTGNYSYNSSRIHGDGYLLLGDAFAFVDPIFSSGVYLARVGARTGAASTDAILRGAAEAPALMRAHESTLRDMLGVFTWFIYRINSPALRRLFMNPRRRFKVKQAVVSVMAGDAAGDSPTRIPILLFKLFYFFASLMDFRATLAFKRRRRRNVEHNVSLVDW